jgi:hypothetical protein
VDDPVILYLATVTQWNYPMPWGRRVTGGAPMTEQACDRSALGAQTFPAFMIF